MSNSYKTKARNAIIEYLKENADTRFTAGDIIKALNKDSDAVDRSTIYRNLERLCSEGTIVKYKESDINASCYQYSEEHAECHSHIHAECEKCGKIFHLDNDIFSEAEKRMISEHGIDIDYGKTVIIGLCDKCRNPQ
ncbi:MAG: transcriptional repressor [Lachnospiraceae bacterium]|nr:transcriptional repressor [Lachnospiraceae bacterium]